MTLSHAKMSQLFTDIYWRCRIMETDLGKAPHYKIGNHRRIPRSRLHPVQAQGSYMYGLLFSNCHRTRRNKAPRLTKKTIHRQLRKVSANIFIVNFVWTGYVVGLSIQKMKVNLHVGHHYPHIIYKANGPYYMYLPFVKNSSSPFDDPLSNGNALWHVSLKWAYLFKILVFTDRH